MFKGARRRDTLVIQLYRMMRWHDLSLPPTLPPSLYLRLCLGVRAYAEAVYGSGQTYGDINTQGRKRACAACDRPSMAADRFGSARFGPARHDSTRMQWAMQSVEPKVLKRVYLLLNFRDPHSGFNLAQNASKQMRKRGRDTRAYTRTHLHTSNSLSLFLCSFFAVSPDSFSFLLSYNLRWSILFNSVSLPFSIFRILLSLIFLRFFSLPFFPFHISFSIYCACACSPVGSFLKT